MYHMLHTQYALHRFWLNWKVAVRTQHNARVTGFRIYAYWVMSLECWWMRAFLLSARICMNTFLVFSIYQVWHKSSRNACPVLFYKYQVLVLVLYILCAHAIRMVSEWHKYWTRGLLHTRVLGTEYSSTWYCSSYSHLGVSLQIWHLAYFSNLQTA